MELLRSFACCLPDNMRIECILSRIFRQQWNDCGCEAVAGEPRFGKNCNQPLT
jgi:hypothetical protein